jgi:hypothetical protein
LKLNPGLIKYLYEADLADEDSHKELVDGHSFTKTIDEYKFKYSIEPYGTRHGYYKPNSVIIIFYPAEITVKKKKKYIGYEDGETDEIFRNIVKVVGDIPLKAIRKGALTLKSINNVHRGISRPVSTANEVFYNPNIKHLISSFAVGNKSYNTRSTVRKVKEVYNQKKKVYNKILENIGENNNNTNDNNK